jgi:hypothetical protein
VERHSVPILNLAWHAAIVERQRSGRRAVVGRRSEVKEESRAQPGSGDMSGVGHPPSCASAKNNHLCKPPAFQLKQEP